MRLGFSMVPAMDAALGALSRERSGSGSGLLMTLRQTGAAIGIALLGSMLTGTYEQRLDTGGLPHAAAEAAGDSGGGRPPGRRAAGRGRGGRLRGLRVRGGMNLVLTVCGLTVLAAALTAAVAAGAAGAAAAAGAAEGVAATAGRHDRAVMAAREPHGREWRS